MTTWFASNNGDLGGGEVMLVNLAMAAHVSGRSVGVVAPATPAAVARESLRRGLRTTEIRGSDRRAYLRGLRRWDRASRSGLLWCNGLVPGFATTGRARRVLHLHQVPRSAPQWLAARAASVGTERLIVPSAAMADSIADRLGRRPRVLWNWTEPFLVPDRPPSSHVFKVGFLGRTSVGKGILVLAEALRLLAARHRSEVGLVLAGEPRFADAHEQALVEAALDPIAPLVERVGWLAPGDFFSRVDLAVFPSIVPETFGLVVAEAQYARTPYVVSDAGALPEVAGPEHPWVASAGSAESLADVIERAMAGTESAVLDTAHRRWEHHFSPAAGRARLNQLLSDLDNTL